MSFRTVIHITTALLLTVTPALAQDSSGTHTMPGGMSMPGMSMPGMAMPDGAQDFYKDAMERMHRDMAITPTGDADVDFVRGMIPHHQGAIDMAKAVLEHGKDPEIRKLAEGVISAQEGEIAFMKEWLKKHGE